MTTTPDKVKWKTFTPAELTADQAKLLAEFDGAQKVAKAKRESFEASIRKAADLPKTLACIFTYRYGAAMAVVPADQVKARKAGDKPKQSLADYLAAAKA